MAEHEQVLAAAENLVDRRKLPGEPQRLANGNGVVQNIKAEHLGPARVWLEQRGEHADERRLARPVGTEQAKDGSLADFEVDSGEGCRPTEALDETLDAN